MLFFCRKSISMVMVPMHCFALSNVYKETVKRQSSKVQSSTLKHGKFGKFTTFHPGQAVNNWVFLTDFVSPTLKFCYKTKKHSSCMSSENPAAP